MEVHVVFNALKRNDPQDRIRDVTNECLICHVRVDVQLVTMRVEVDTVFETLYCRRCNFRTDLGRFQEFPLMRWETRI